LGKKPQEDFPRDGGKQGSKAPSSTPRGKESKEPEALTPGGGVGVRDQFPEELQSGRRHKAKPDTHSFKRNPTRKREQTGDFTAMSPQKKKKKKRPTQEGGRKKRGGGKGGFCVVTHILKKHQG